MKTVVFVVDHFECYTRKGKQQVLYYMLDLLQVGRRAGSNLASEGPRDIGIQTIIQVSTASLGNPWGLVTGCSRIDTSMHLFELSFVLLPVPLPPLLPPPLSCLASDTRCIVLVMRSACLVVCSYPSRSQLSKPLTATNDKQNRRQGGVAS